MNGSTDFFTLRQFAEKHPAFSINGLRWLRFNSPENGYSTAFVKQGGKILVKESEFFRILESRGLEVENA